MPIKLHFVDTGLDLGTGIKENISTAEMHLTKTEPYLSYRIMLPLSRFLVD